MQPSIDDLRALPLFGGIPEDALVRFVDRCEVQHVEAGAAVFDEGETARTLYVLKEGTLDIVKRRGDGEVLIGEVHPGECFGEMSFIDMQPRSATVRARTGAEIWLWTYQSIHQRYCQDQKCAMLLVMNIARELSRRLRRSDDFIAARTDI